MSGGGDDRLRELGQQLPAHVPDDATRGAVREALLEAAARERSRPRGRWGFVVGAFGVGALAAAAAMIWLARARAPEPVTSTPVAVQPVPMPVPVPVPMPVPAPVPAPAPAPPRLVRVHTGALHVGASEHVQLATSDATVAGDADYDIAVTGDTLRSVAVHSGKVVLRVRGQQEVFLGAGDTWKPKPVVAREAEEIEPSTSAVTSPSTSPTTTEAQKMTESHFQSGWQLMKAGKYDDAARELAAAADAGGPLAGDARYFEAEALTKAGHAPEAERALLAFLDASPRSLRRGRASVMLARLIAARGDTRSARTWLESALHDADPDVVAAANAGLAALH